MISKSLKETQKLAKEFVGNIKASDKGLAFVVAMHGDLGSGKTTFVKAVAKAFGIENTVTSPTFVIEKIYKLENQEFDNLIHIDAYRLKSGEELKTIGWEEVSKNPKNIIFIEWPNNVEDILPESKQEIIFKFVDENTREIEVK
ncbi:tRNA (adenosine(37)-N6)-threonylcarbamoyltransferase complex ATPase subunit type 1 TsaE [bacterium]|jgi:tRNA threonylcarbamoyladenosine biosynthesis protein TsaE|nr:tRNA (adenosine(37)-N6)-threonylcarbamoyltransferase complex ATPase subunit type 1 TsaE [bacterium]MBT3729757.1 tRNA (adenosine(37)-N6)-threonylcarbamoyltransferase complex ATPase subunit type 1 TsaE [bacterium]MBT4894736.1 tRNA (adenosine(37)-N6)-threonylcarbamoyltransferase complex ATPase subunit type 1 TsaE [bacterium]